MSYIRNVVFFSIIALLVGACGGGDTVTTASGAIADPPANTGNSPGTGTGTGSGSPTTNTITLKWTAPTTRLDNSPVTAGEVSAYRLYYGPSATNTPTVIQITDGTVTQYTVTLPSGTYYFRISAIDTDGYEGALSSARQETL